MGHPKKASAKSAPPFYTIESIRKRKPRIDHFDMMRLEKDLPEIGYSLKPHSHDCYLIIVITHGEGTHTIDGEHYKVEPNTIFLLSQGQVHSFEFSDDIAGYVVYFTMDFYLYYARERHFDKIPFFRSMQPQTFVKTNATSMKFITVLLDEMLHEFTLNQKAKEEALQNFLDILLIRINRLWKLDRMIKGKVSGVVQLRKLLALIEAHYKKARTAGDYARMLNLTPNYLNTLCRQSINRTVTELIQDRTILEAKRQLAYTEWGVKNIASNLGFKDSSYFLRLFKKKTGLTPDKFRVNSNSR